MERIPAEEAKKNFADVVNLVANAKQRFLIQEKGQDRAAVIPLEDLALLENLDQHEVAVEHLTDEEVRKHLREDIALVADRAGRIVVRRNGEDVAALVPNRDLAVLEGLDQSIDLEAAKRLLEGELEVD